MKVNLEREKENKGREENKEREWQRMKVNFREWTEAGSGELRGSRKCLE